jgi:hypothetical protein
MTIPEEMGGGAIECMSWNREKCFIAFGTRDETVQVWKADLHEGVLLRSISLTLLTRYLNKGRLHALWGLRLTGKVPRGISWYKGNLVVFELYHGEMQVPPIIIYVSDIPSKYDSERRNRDPDFACCCYLSHVS